MPTDDKDAEFTAAVRRAGLVIPTDRWAPMRDAYFSMQALLKVLDDPLTYGDEPAVLPLLVPRSAR
jgi:hypothetical protein